MSSSTINRRLAVLLMLLLGGAFFYATYNTIENIVAEQSRVQQEAVSPVYDLVGEELLRPLYIAETFANTVDFTVDMNSPEFDESVLLRRLRDMQAEMDLTFFVASELTRKQYFSNGTTLDLVEGEVAWYFEAKAQDKDFMADLGQVGDVHLFYDVKILGSNGEFLGYVGVGKHTQSFIDTFNSYKERYGYDFLFVNDRDEIMLTSIPELVVTDAYIPSLDTLDWFDHGDSLHGSHDSEIFEIDGEDVLISEFVIEELGWRLLLLSPLEGRQAQTARTFVSGSVGAVLSVLLFLLLVVYSMRLYRETIQKQSEMDELTGLPNRTSVQRRYNQLQRDGKSLCAVIIDLDHFKSINDTYGHDAGDRVLKAAATVFKEVLRANDTVGRWGGEEFVMLLPEASSDTGVAIAERARQKLEDLTIELRDAEVSVTASFGVASGPTRNELLADLLARADKVLYEAKEKGRNQVRLFREAS